MKQQLIALALSTALLAGSAAAIAPCTPNFFAAPEP